MNSYEIIVTPDAEADLHEIRDYIAETLLAPDVALNYIRVIRKEMEKLSYMAEALRRRNVSRRKIIAKNFYIYYRPDEVSGRVYVLNVIYAKRDQLKALSKMNLYD